MRAENNHLNTYDIIYASSVIAIAYWGVLGINKLLLKTKDFYLLDLVFFGQHYFH